MVKCFSILIVFIHLLLVTPSTFAQLATSFSQLSASISRTDKQWGQYLNATLRYRGPLKLSDIDLSPWQQLAAITLQDETTELDARGRTIQVAQLRLHPRSIGSQSLPALKLGGASSSAIAIQISEPIVEEAPIKLQWQVSNTSPWQREAIIIRVHLQTADYAAHVLVDAINDPSFISRSLSTERLALDNGEYRYNTGWILYPIDAGDISLDLPPIKYQLSGSDRRRFHLPELALNVKALPAYLPPTLPVGKLAIQSEIKPAINNLYRWHIKIHTDGLIPYGIPGLDAQLATVGRNDIGTITVKHQQQSSYHNYSSQNIYTALMPDWLLPYSRRPVITLRYFDPETGRLQQISHSLATKWNMPGWAWWVTTGIILLTAIYLISIIWPLVTRQRKRLAFRRELKATADARQLRKIILNYSQCLTLSEWAYTNNIDHGISDELNKHCFSSESKTNPQQLKQRLLAAA